MAQYSRIETALKMKEMGVIPVFYNGDIDICKNVVKACYDGGLRVVEFTNRDDFAHEVFAELSRYVRDELPGMILGVGTVVDAPTAALYIQLGANFIVSPYLKEDMAIVCNRRKILWCPGCGSLSEISRAEELGAEIIKIFPAKQVGGPGFVKAIKSPCPWTDIMPTGGVEPTEENLKLWFDAGVTCVGMGSKLVSKDIIRAGDYKTLTDKVKDVISIINKVRSH
jgi:2-dehydro-3-deoxyphosphogluconate aldolase/(4S)-4-hydroxy-2-oxoglutarate aldolase